MRGSAIAVANATAHKVVRAHLDADPVPEQNTNAKPPHLAGRIRQDIMPVVEADRILRISHGIRHGAIHFNRIAFWHCLLTFREPPEFESRVAASTTIGAM